MVHDITLTTARRQLGRSRVTDHFWRCSCGEATTAPTGFSTRDDAWVNGLAHRRKYVPPQYKEVTAMNDNPPVTVRGQAALAWVRNFAQPTKSTDQGGAMTSNQTGEVTNLTSSIKFCEASASSARDLVGEVETFTASLTDAGVSGEPLRLAAHAMELAEELGSMFDDLGGELQRHTVVAEAYESVGEDAAENKQFNQVT